MLAATWEEVRFGKGRREETEDTHGRGGKNMMDVDLLNFTSDRVFAGTLWTYVDLFN